jgi:ferrous iron transport protein A
VTLADLKPGQAGRISALAAGGALKRRLMDMGLLPGVEIRVEKVAPLGDPLEVQVRSYHLSLRRQEAEGIAVEVQP